MTFSTVLLSTIRECSWALAKTSASTAAPTSSVFSSGVLFTLSSAILNIQIFHELSTRCNEVFAWLDFTTHKLVKYIVCFLCVFDFYLNEHSFLRIHSCIK